MFTIYVLFEATKPDEIRYVGVTEHPLAARWTGHQSAPWRLRAPVSAWLSRAFDAGTVIECRAIERTKEAGRAREIEKKWIAHHSRTGNLLNVTHNPATKAVSSPGPNPEDPAFGEESAKNFLQYLRVLPI